MHWDMIGNSLCFLANIPNARCTLMTKCYNFIFICFFWNRWPDDGLLGRKNCCPQCLIFNKRHSCVHGASVLLYFQMLVGYSTFCDLQTEVIPPPSCKGDMLLLDSVSWQRVTYSWFKSTTAFWMMHAFFWVIHQHLQFKCQRFRTRHVPSS
jgi:hypothetical protein